MKKALAALDAMVDIVLAYRPRLKAKTKAVQRKPKKRSGRGKIVNP